MTQFYIPDEESRRRCEISRDSQRPDTFSGVGSITATVKIYTSVVQSIEDNGPGSPVGRRWRVTLFPS
jgi:hypothetical protein